MVRKKKETTNDHFDKRREETPYYPFFKSNESGIYFFQIRSIMLYVMSGLFILLLIALVAILTQNWRNAFVIIIVGAEIIILFFIIYFSPKMTYVINRNNQRYQYYKGKTLEAEGEFTDIYIRLRKDSLKQSGSRYYIVLDGIGIDSVRLTKKDKDIPNLRKIGQQIAEVNNLNYFDKENFSPHHKVIHKKEKKNDTIN